MTQTVLTVEDAAAGLSELVERVRTRHEAAVITVSGEPVARIVPIPAPINGSEDLIAFLRRWRSQYPDPDEQFAEAIEETRKIAEPMRNPWD
jgi:prevent-host-death family protein